MNITEYLDSIENKTSIKISLDLYNMLKINKPITSFDGIENYPNILSISIEVRLELSEKEYEKLNILKELTHYTSYGNDAYLKHLSNNLIFLKLESCNIKDKDNLILFKKLINLSLLFCSIKNDELYFIKDLININVLKIVNFDDLYYSTKFEKFITDKSSFITDISCLKNLNNIRDLDVSHNKIEDISVLEYLTNIERMDISYNEIINIEVFKHLKKIYCIDISNNIIEDISPLMYFERMYEFDINLKSDYKLNIYGGNSIGTFYSSYSSFNFHNNPNLDDCRYVNFVDFPIFLKNKRRKNLISKLLDNK
jgi:hypothetical protein